MGIFENSRGVGGSAPGLPKDSLNNKAERRIKMQRVGKDNKIHFLIEPDGRVKYRIAQSTSYEMHIHLEEIARETKKYMQNLLRKKFPKAIRS